MKLDNGTKSVQESYDKTIDALASAIASNNLQEQARISQTFFMNHLLPIMIAEAKSKSLVFADQLMVENAIKEMSIRDDVTSYVKNAAINDFAILSKDLSKAEKDLLAEEGFVIASETSDTIVYKRNSYSAKIMNSGKHNL